MVYILQEHTIKKIQSIDSQHPTIIGLVLDDSGSRVMTCGSDNKLRVWNIGNWEIIYTSYRS